MLITFHTALVLLLGQTFFYIGFIYDIRVFQILYHSSFFGMHQFDLLHLNKFSRYVSWSFRNAALNICDSSNVVMLGFYVLSVYYRIVSEDRLYLGL